MDIGNYKAVQHHEVCAKRIRLRRARSSAWIERLPSIPSEDSRKSRDRSPPGPLELVILKILDALTMYYKQF
jgi:hypothetical protein